MKELLFGTNNKHKLEEIRLILQDKINVLGLGDVSIDVDVEETEHTLEGNAKLKAKTYFEHSQIPCFSDDTGLEVDALHGAPGVFSARYAGPNASYSDNVNKLLKALDGISKRDARFRTVIAYFDGHSFLTFEGKVEGSIIYQSKGENGFGYDPVFLPEGFDKTFAEMEAAEKHVISHRGKAIQAFISYLQSTFQD